MRLKFTKHLIGIFFIYYWVSLNAFGQELSIKGTLIDKKTKETIIGAGVLLTSVEDSTSKTGTSSDLNGRFYFTFINLGQYVLKVVHLGYQPFSTKILLDTANIDLGTILLNEFDYELDEIVVKAPPKDSTLKIDTIYAQPKAYTTNLQLPYVNPSAYALDVLSKMPGVFIVNGAIKIDGQNVSRILIDGKEFFGTNVALALQTIPAEMIHKIEVNNHASDLSRLNGVNDINRSKTINIITKPELSNSIFGRLINGNGASIYTNNYDYRYFGSFNVNYFTPKRKITLIANANNINVQNFGTDDILNSITSNGQGSVGSFLGNLQGGINKVNSVGLNYIDEWGKDLSVNGNYVFSSIDNQFVANKYRSYILSSQTNQTYFDTTNNNSRNQTHTLGLKFTINNTKKHTFIVSPKIVLQNYKAENILSGTSFSPTTIASDVNNGINMIVLPVTSSDNINKPNNVGYELNNSITYRYKFIKAKRSLSANISTVFNQTNNINFLNYKVFTFRTNALSTPTNQNAFADVPVFNGSATLAYTEPLFQSGLLQFNYTPSINYSSSNRLTYNLNTVTGLYTVSVNNLTNQYTNTIIINRGGVNYQWTIKNFRGNFGVNFQHTSLNGKQIIPDKEDLSKPFFNMTPFVIFNYAYKNTFTASIAYKTSTGVPSIGQLQGILNNTNPLLLSIGLPDLSQSLTHTFESSFKKTNEKNTRSLLLLLNTFYTNGYITSTNYIAANANLTTSGGVVVTKGTQLSRLINQDGYHGGNTSINYNQVIKQFKSNLNVNLGVNFTNTPIVINESINRSKTYNINSNVVLGSNISQGIDFTFTNAANYYIVKNDLQPDNNSNNYLYVFSSAKLSLIPYKNWSITNELAHTVYTGLASFDLNILLWNPSVGYRFLKNEVAEVKLTTFDLLGQNKSVNRNVTASYIDDNRVKVLSRYLLLTFTYKFKQFKSEEKQAK
jgi:hypothetical protein